MHIIFIDFCTTPPEEVIITGYIEYSATQAISLAEHDINDVDCELKLDYKVFIFFFSRYFLLFQVLIPTKGRGESAMFMAFIETG